MPEIERLRIKDEIEMKMFRFWQLLPEPKQEYTSWFYGGAKEALRKIYSDAEVVTACGNPTKS